MARPPDHVAAPQLTVDREIERREIAPPALNLQLGSDRPDVARPQRRLGANKLALVKVCEVQACRQQAIDGLPWSVSLVERQISMCLR